MNKKILMLKRTATAMVYFLLPAISTLSGQILQNSYSRPDKSLNGTWHYVIDPYETGYRNHRNWVPYDVMDYNKPSAKPYYTNKQMENRWDRIEYDFESSPSIQVPSDWNSQDPKLLYYEGTIWYYKKFDYQRQESGRVFLHFGGANYCSDVYLNGTKLGQHRGGFDPFNYEISNTVREKDNYLIVRVDNKREVNNVPNRTTDWWNYGGITRDVKIIEVPQTYIDHYQIQLDKENPDFITGFVRLNGTNYPEKIRIEIPELKIRYNAKVDHVGNATLQIKADKLKRWYPERPKLYDVIISSGEDEIKDEIGFRTIEVVGQEILLNGKKIFLRGISMHEEFPLEQRRAKTMADAEIMLGWAKELNCNFIRLAHYPHNENMNRLADKTGILLWEEIPVYWGINYENEETYLQAKNQLVSLIQRDINRASVIIWSLANETPVIEARTQFLNNLKSEVLNLDKNRMVSAALERHLDENTNKLSIKDPFAKEVDILSCNEYIGWYGSLPGECNRTSWDLPENKPFLISEFGAGALYGNHGDSLSRWTEEYQEYLYKEQIKMLKKIPTLRGMTPWILFDFRSPRRNLPGIQDGWNRKGLLSDKGEKKKAYYLLKSFYDEMEERYSYVIDN